MTPNEKTTYRTKQRTKVLDSFSAHSRREIVYLESIQRETH